MGDQRIRAFMEKWFVMNKEMYGHTPFNWGAKHAKLIQSLLKQLDDKALSHTLLEKAAIFYFKQDGFEKKMQCHSFGFFFNNFQKYLQAVLPQVVKKEPLQKSIVKEPEPDKNALEKYIVKTGPTVIKDFMKGKKFMPAAQFEKAMNICKKLWPEHFKSHALETVTYNKPEDRRSELQEQAKKLLHNERNSLQKI